MFIRALDHQNMDENPLFQTDPYYYQPNTTS